jgi:hypothetical protein
LIMKLPVPIARIVQPNVVRAERFETDLPDRFGSYPDVGSFGLPWLRRIAAI